MMKRILTTLLLAAALLFEGWHGPAFAQGTFPGVNPVFNGNMTLNGTFTTSSVVGSTQCAQFNSSGLMSGTGLPCGGPGSLPGGGNGAVQFNNSGSFGGSPNLSWTSPTLSIGMNATLTGQLALANGGGGGASVTIQNLGATSAYNFNLPTTAGSANQILASQGGVSTSETWVNVASLLTAGTNITVTGTTNATINAVPSSPTTGVQFNNGGVFGADSGFTYAGTGQATLALGTITASEKALNITGTWNNGAVTFEGPIFENITLTAEAAASMLLDLQAGGTSQLILQPKTNAILSLGDGAAASTLRVYNTVDTLSGPTNFERGALDWITTPNTFTIATQQGGTGSARGILLSAAGTLTLNTGNATDTILINSNGTTSAVLFDNAGANIWKFGQQFQFGWTPTSPVAPGQTPDTGINRQAVGVLGITDGQGNLRWSNWAGEARVTSDFSVTSNTTLANVPGLSVTLQAGRKYLFEIPLFMTDTGGAGGVKIALSGTATITNLIADGICVDGTANVAVTRISAFSQMVASTMGTTTPRCTLWGEFEVNAAGTLTVQFAQNVSSANASAVKRGSYMIVHDQP